MGRGLWRRDPVRIFLVAIGVRALFAAQTRGDPLFSILGIDARSYFELASRFAHGDWLFGRDPLWFAPLYPVLLGGLFRLAGPDPALARALQHVLGAATAAIATGLGARLSRGAGRIAGLLLALFPIALYYEGQLLYTSLAAFLTALFLGRFLGALEGERARAAAGAGLVLGLLGLARSNALAFLPFGTLVLALRRGRRAAVLFAVASLAALLPVLARNGLVSGAWTPLTVNGGMIFATGFAEESVGGRALQRSPSDFGPHGAFHREAERAAGRSLSLAEASRFHRDQTLRRIAADPARAARLAGRKALLLANVREIDDHLGFELLRRRSPLLSWLPGPWAWIVLPAAMGALAFGRRPGPAGQTARLLLLYGGVYGASLLLFFVTARYRFPLVVPGAVLAGAGIAHAARELRRGAIRRVALPAAGAAAVAPLVLRDPGVRADPALGLVAVGAALEREGLHADALAVTERAIAIDPRVAGAHQNRALALLGLGREAEALRAAEEATRLDPDLAAAWSTRGAILARAGGLEEALVAFRRAAELAPADPDALANLAQALAATGRLAEAIRVGRRAVDAGAGRLAPELRRWTERVQPPRPDGR